MTKNIVNKKRYEKPAMEVYLIPSEPKILAGSDEPLGGPWPGGAPW